MITFLDYQWIEFEEDLITIGISSEGLDQFKEIERVNLPDLEEDVYPNQSCMEILTDEGTFNIYSPVEGQIVDVNTAISEEPNLILEDNYGDGWLIKIEATEPINIEEIKQTSREDV